MDSFRHKTKKDHHNIKHVDKGKSNLFIRDVKAIKENIKIKELLRTVKMNSSMRVKAPPGKKVMENEDLTEDNLDFEQNEEQENCTYASVCKLEDNTCPEFGSSEKDSGTDSRSLDLNNTVIISYEEEPQNVSDSDKLNLSNEIGEKVNNDIPILSVKQVSKEISNENEQIIISDVEENNISEDTPTIPLSVSNDSTLLRNRKLSLDHTMLTRMQSMSQSEIDLHSMGKSPLERKSSFFRKKMDNFLKNTTDIFRRHSSHYKGQPVQRRGSMSVSLQSLNENDNSRDFNLNSQGEPQGSTTSIQTCSTLGRSSRSECPEQGSLAGSQSSIGVSQSALCTSQPIIASDSIKNLTDPCLQESLLNSRAISMSSGLDSVQAHRRSTRAKRVTWVASEGLHNYLKRLIQDEKKKEPVYHSQQDLSSIKENGSYRCSKTDMKGRRLSYQRAVSGEDPAPWLKHHDSSYRRKQTIAEHQETSELLEELEQFDQFGIPPIKGYTIVNIPDEALWCLSWAEQTSEFEEFFEWKMRKCNTEPPDRLRKRFERFQNRIFFQRPFDLAFTPNDEARQAVIRELVLTEASYIKHLHAIVEVFMASAHALQDRGKLLDVDTERLFANIPDVLNASLLFFATTMYPMMIDAINNNTPFNTDQMALGFCHFHELFRPYEKYVSEQSKALDYMRSLGTNQTFKAYIQWCHSQEQCNRLQLNDIMVKPMQRLTKYSLILRRLILHTETEPERTSLLAMETFATNYVLDINRSIRQRDELEIMDHLANIIETYEVDFKDEDLDRFYRMHACLNLKEPMVNSLPNHSRSLIYQGDLRFKDNHKEMDVRAILLTDMLLICRKQNKGQYQYKMIRPKYMVDKMNQYPMSNGKVNKELSSIVCVMVDEVESSYTAFTLSEPKEKDALFAPGGLKIWDQKFKEAKLTYELGVWYAKNPSRDISEVEMDTSSECGAAAKNKQSTEENIIERDARERVAAMLHRNMGASTEYDCSQGSMLTDSFDVEGEVSHTSAGRIIVHRHPMRRMSTGGSSRNSRLSSFQKSTSAASHDEPQAGPSSDYRAGTSVEHLIPPLNPDDAVTSITVNVVSESESDSVVSVDPPPTLQNLQQKSPKSRNTLRVQPSSGVMALVHSLPDLSLDPPRVPVVQHTPKPLPLTASDKLYQSHQELLHRNRLIAQSQHQHQYLTPDSRGTSYPPPSPTRASLKRGLAFSYSMKNPPLSKMGHVQSTSSTSQSTQPDTSAGPSTPKTERGAVNPQLVPTHEKSDKKSKHFSSRHKGSGSGAGPSRSRDDKTE